MKAGYILWTLLFVSATAIAQSTSTIQTLPIAHIAVDRPGDFYVIDTQKKIIKYNPKGEVLAEAVLDKIPTLFDPWSGVRLFTYYADSREIQYLDPTLSLKSILLIDSAFAIEPFLACPSGEYNYWLLDKSDFSLKKILPRESKVQTEVLVGDFLSSPENVLQFREYLNYVFILDKEKGILVFNQLGIKVNQLPASTTDFGFYGEELYYVESNKLVFYDLYNAETKTIQLSDAPSFLLLLQDKKIAVHGQKIEITDFTR